jgi:NAD(P)-dependent dehydrogenase (short-subunit alcohol dehydrogenase family)
MVAAQSRDRFDTHQVHRSVGPPWRCREIAGVIASLASPQAFSITGASRPVDGGILQMRPGLAQTCPETIGYHF